MADSNATEPIPTGVAETKPIETNPTKPLPVGAGVGQSEQATQTLPLTGDSGTTPLPHVQISGTAGVESGTEPFAPLGWPTPAPASSALSGEKPTQALPTVDQSEQATQTLPTAGDGVAATQALPSLQQEPLQATQALPSAGLVGSAGLTDSASVVAGDDAAPTQAFTPTEQPTLAVPPLGAVPVAAAQETTATAQPEPATEAIPSAGHEPNSIFPAAADAAPANGVLGVVSSFAETEAIPSAALKATPAAYSVAPDAPAAAPADSAPQSQPQQPAYGANPYTQQGVPVSGAPAYDGNGSVPPQGATPVNPVYGNPVYGNPGPAPQSNVPQQYAPQQDVPPQAQNFPPQGGVPPYGQYPPYAGGNGDGTGGNAPLSPADDPYNPNNQKYNGLAVAGFICSFFVAVIGLILSIIGLNQIKKQGGKGKGLATAGIVISIISMVLSIVLVVVGLAGSAAIANKAIQDTQSDSSYSQSDSGTDSSTGGDSSTDSNSDSSDLDNLDNSLDSTLNDTENDLSSGDYGLYDSVQAFVDSDDFKSSVQSEVDSLSGSGITFSYHVEGDTLVYEYTVGDEYAAAGDSIASSVSALSDTYQSTADMLGTMCKTSSGKASLRVYMHTASGQSLFDQTWTEQ